MLLKMFERALSASQSNCQVTTMFDTGSVSSQNSIAIVNESKTALTVLSITINWLVANDWLIFTFLLVPMWFNVKSSATFLPSLSLSVPELLVSGLRKLVKETNGGQRVTKVGLGTVEQKSHSTEMLVQVSLG